MQSQDDVAPRFRAKKDDILKSLSVPEDQYTDLSPKGSVDEGIRELIGLVNQIDGFVTTSSCAGRVSVFLEGKKDGLLENMSTREGGTDINIGSEKPVSVPGGKGMGGRWLFISHVPVATERLTGLTPVHDMFNLVPSKDASSDAPMSFGKLRLARLQFEPMILHVMTCSLRHAQRILAAAMNAGFRESGLQSLRALDDNKALPMVAVRTAGLGISSVVGIANDLPSEGCVARSLVSEGYLRMMLQVCNQRFEENTTRTARFVDAIKSMGTAFDPAAQPVLHQRANWEDKRVRAERKRREGLARQKAVAAAAGAAEETRYMDIQATDISGISTLLDNNDHLDI